MARYDGKHAPVSHIATEGMELKIQALNHLASCYG